MGGGNVISTLDLGYRGDSPIGKFVRSTKWVAQQGEGAPAPTPYPFFAP